MSTPPPVTVQLGPFAVEITSDLPDALTDVQALYSGQLRPPVPETAQIPVIRVSARRETSRWSPLARYSILGDGVELFTNRRANEVLPYLEWGINWRMIATQRQYLQLHAATLARDGAGLIIAARSGSGKSTLAAALLARGWQYLSDEFALLDPATLTLHPFPKALCIKAGSFPLVQALGLPLWRRRHYAKAFKGAVGYVNPHTLGPGSIGATCPVRLVLFPEYRALNQPCTLPITRAAAALELGELSFNREHFAAAGMNLLTTLAAHATCLRLHSGDLDATCQLVEQCFDAVAGQTTYHLAA